MSEANTKHKTDWQAWLKKIGLAGFLFFLVKGLIWLGVFAFAGKALFD